MKKVIALLLLLIGLLQYRLWFGDGNVLEFHRLTDRIVELRQEGAKRRERNAALEAEVMDLKQGLDAVEERARQDLGMIKEGEVFVQVIDPHHDPDALPTPTEGNASTAPGNKTGAGQEKPQAPKTREANVSPPTKSQAASGTDKPKAATPPAKPSSPPKAAAKPRQPPKEQPAKPKTAPLEPAAEPD